MEEWKYHYGDPDEEWARDDWNSQGKAWDQAAWLEGDLDLSKLKEEKAPEESGEVEVKTKKRQKTKKTEELEEHEKPATKKRTCKQTKDNSGTKPSSSKGAMKRPAAALDSKKAAGEEKEKKSRARSKPKVGEAVVEEVLLYTKRICKFCRLFKEHKDDELTQDLKGLLKSKLTPAQDFNDSKYNIYWHLTAAGLKSKTDQKDHGFMSVSDESAGPFVYRMAAVLKASEQLVSRWQILECHMWMYVI